MMNQQLRRQPDEPKPICPYCGQLWPEQDGDVEKFLVNNAGNFSSSFLARMLCWSQTRLERYCRNHKPPIDLTLKKEPEGRG